MLIKQIDKIKVELCYKLGRQIQPFDEIFVQEKKKTKIMYKLKRGKDRHIHIPPVCKHIQILVNLHKKCCFIRVTNIGLDGINDFLSGSNNE